MDHQQEEQDNFASVDNRERRRLLAAASSAAVLGGVGAWGRALAQDPGPLPGVLRILVGSAGAGPDLTARVVAEQLRAAYGWNVVVENRLGAGGRIAIEATRNAPPDGMTLMLVSIELLSLYPLVYTRLGYDPFNDFAMVAGVSSAPYALAVNPKSGHDTLASLVAWCKANPRAAAYGTPGLGTPQHFLGNMLGRDAGMDFNHIPYKGGAPAMQDLAGGQVPCVITSHATAAPLMRAGSIRVLAHSAAARLRSAPEVPTFAELGYKSMVAEGDFLLATHVKAPADVVRRVSAAVLAQVRGEAARAGLGKLGQDPLPVGPAELNERLQRNHALWAGVVKSTGFKAVDE